MGRKRWEEGRLEVAGAFLGRKGWEEGRLEAGWKFLTEYFVFIDN